MRSGRQRRCEAVIRRHLQSPAVAAHRPALSSVEASPRPSPAARPTATRKDHDSCHHRITPPARCVSTTSRSPTTATASSSPRSATTTRARSSRRSELFDEAKARGAHAVKLQKRDNRGLYTRETVQQARTRTRTRFGADLRRAPRGARVRPRRSTWSCSAYAARARDHVLRDGVRPRQRRLPRRARHAGLQDRVGRPDQHAAAPPRRRDRQADRSSRPAARTLEDVRRALRDGRGDQPAGRAPAVHRRAIRRRGRSSTCASSRPTATCSPTPSSGSRATTTASPWRSPRTCSARASSRSTSRSTAR